MDKKKYYYTHRAINMWNSLPKDGVMVPGIKSFKKVLYRGTSVTYYFVLSPDLFQLAKLLLADNYVGSDQFPLFFRCGKAII